MASPADPARSSYQAPRAAGLGEDQTGIDVATFIAWADADGRGEDDPADFYVERFRDEFTVAFDARIATFPVSIRI